MAERSNVGIVLVLVILLVGLLFILPMFGMGMWGPMMMGGGMMGGWGCPTGMGWGFGFAAMLVPLLFIVLLVVGAYLLLARRGEPAESGRPLTILNERYAKGEITKEQYLAMREHLAEK